MDKLPYFNKMSISELNSLSDEYCWSLNEAELKVIQEHFLFLDREPKRGEIETIAQTWSEHCKHKTFNARIVYVEDKDSRIFENLFKETIKKSTLELMAEKDFLVSVFEDNAGIIKFNEDYNVAFKVETHNHPSALVPYGGASTGIGGVIRDILGCGIGAWPIANTYYYCFAEPNHPAENIKKGIIHPKRIYEEVHAGSRDYGNRMGIPTFAPKGGNFFHKDYLGNSLVYVGTVGIMPSEINGKESHKKNANPGDLIVVLGGGTGRDGIHGATFSSAELTQKTSSGAVQIGNPIEERKVMDLLMKARDLGLYNSITDCGAGGFSSAIGEMASNLGCIVNLENAPLKYLGLEPWEIWVSESQERMIVSVSKENLEKLKEMAGIEDVSIAVLGKFTDDKVLDVKYEEEQVIKLGMDFLHEMNPKQSLKAKWKEKKLAEPIVENKEDYNSELEKILCSFNLCSKESTIRQYDHEVQGTSIIKPLQGKNSDVSGDAVVIKPLYGSWKGIVLSAGINPNYSKIDTYWMAASAIDEAIRQLVCVGADPQKIVLLDNFCWGNPNDEEKLGDLVRAATACYDFSKGFKTPFISGKDSFYNEFEGESIPATLLISSLGVMQDVRKSITMDLKKPCNNLYLLGTTKDELGGSEFYKLFNETGNNVPKVDYKTALDLYKDLHNAIGLGLVESCHDISLGGLAVALSEMAMAGEIGVVVNLEDVIVDDEKMYQTPYKLLFSESNSRFIVEIDPNHSELFESVMENSPCRLIGKATGFKTISISYENKTLISKDILTLKEHWKSIL